MNIVMLEPLGVSQALIDQKIQHLLDAGHTFRHCERPISSEEKLERLQDADILIIANSPLTSEMIEAAPKLRMISVGFTGIDHVAIDTCRKKDITVCNSQGYATDSTGELALTLMLSCLRNIPAHDRGTRNGETLSGYTHNTLNGKTVGIVGTGAIGTKVALLTRAFGCKVLAYSRTEKPELKEMGIEYCSLDHLFSESDIISLHVPLTPETKNLVNRKLIDSMKKTAVLINCARGPVLDSQALADALNEDRIAKAGIDVYEMEPPILQDHPLLNAKNTILTPHVGFYSEESLAARLDIVLDNITSWLAGKPINVK